MANILVLSYLPVHPAHGGGRVRIRQIATRLAERHRVAVLCPPTGDDGVRLPFDVYNSGIAGKRQLADPRLYARVLEVARRVRPDVVLLEYAWQGMHAMALRVLRGVPVALDAFDVVTHRLRSAGHPAWLAMSVYERLLLRGVDRVFAVSEIDRDELVRMGARATSTAVVPNGVDTAEFRPDDAAGRDVRARLGVHSGERMLLFFGQLDYAPNAHAVRTLAEDVMPRLDTRYRLFVAGRGDATALRGRYETEQVRFLGAVDPLPAYINAADAVVAPLQSGSGTRLKILESLACGAPTVATPFAALGIDAGVCGPALRIAAGRDFAAAVETAADGPKREPSVQFRETYDWGAIVGRMELP